jgi:pre-rRNA-processing protein TSR2
METYAGPSETSVLFARGVIARLAIWPALRIAVEQGWGGPDGVQKRRWLASVIVDAFEEQHPTPDVTYIEETLLQVMEDEFETSLEDSSAEVVAGDIVGLWEQVHGGEQVLVLKFEELAEKLKGKQVNAQMAAASDDNMEDEDSVDDDDDSSDDEAPRLLDSQSKQTKNEPEVDEDGFTMVKGRSRT